MRLTAQQRAACVACAAVLLALAFAPWPSAVFWHASSEPAVIAAAGAAVAAAGAVLNSGAKCPLGFTAESAAGLGMPSGHPPVR